MNDVAHVLLGAALVAIGILAAALADRIRGICITRERASTTRKSHASVEVAEQKLVPLPKSERARTPRAQSKAQQPAEDVIVALVATGHKKQVATEAVLDCGVAERATIEDWTRAALRRCARGGMS